MILNFWQYPLFSTYITLNTPIMKKTIEELTALSTELALATKELSEQLEEAKLTHAESTPELQDLHKKYRAALDAEIKNTEALAERYAKAGDRKAE
jgi:N-formylglutamate amidohydrolase